MDVERDDRRDDERDDKGLELEEKLGDDGTGGGFFEGGAGSTVTVIIIRRVSATVRSSPATRYRPERKGGMKITQRV